MRVQLPCNSVSIDIQVLQISAGFLLKKIRSTPEVIAARSCLVKLK